MTKRLNVTIEAGRNTTVAVDFQVVDAAGNPVDTTGLDFSIGLADKNEVPLASWTVGSAYDDDGRGAIWTNPVLGKGTWIPGETTSTEVVAARFYQFFVTEGGITLEASPMLPFRVKGSARPEV